MEHANTRRRSDPARAFRYVCLLQGSSGVTKSMVPSCIFVRARHNSSWRYNVHCTLMYVHTKRLSESRPQAIQNCRDVCGLQLRQTYSTPHMDVIEHISHCQQVSFVYLRIAAQGYR
jgi:hypothetical protein